MHITISQITFIQGNDNLGNPNTAQEGSRSLFSLAVVTVTTFGSQGQCINSIVIQMVWKASSQDNVQLLNTSGCRVQICLKQRTAT